MTFLDRILGRRPDPTLNWQTSNAPMPDFDLEAMRFGTLQFGQGFEAAEFLGRPDLFRWTQEEYCELLYASRGFQIDYDERKFAYLAFLIGPDRHQPDHPALKFSTPRLRTPEGVRLSCEADRALLEQLFEAPDSVDAGASQVVLYYTRNHVTMEFEMDGTTGRLKRWNLYPK